MAWLVAAFLLVAGGRFDSYVFRGAPSEHSLLNVEGMLAVAFLLILYLRARPGQMRATFATVAPATVVAIITGVIILAFLAALRNPFLFDDYTHVADASGYTWHTALQQFGGETRLPGLFFRPVGFFLYWLNYLWAGANPVLWHASGLAMHAAAGCLTYALCREVGLSQPAGLGAAVLFSIQGAAAETVAWIDARFDLMATLLVLLSILLVCRYLTTAGRGWLVAALAAGAAAMLTKESGFALPLLIACLAFFRGQAERRRIWLAAGWAGAIAAALFAYRWWALGGIGGYRNPGGPPQVAQFNILHTLNALLLREWAILFFPVNWSMPLGLASRIAVAAIPLILLACALTARVSSRRQLLGCLAFAIAASLPVQHLLLIGSDLGGTRNLYMASIGWVLLWGVVLDGMNGKPALIAACALLSVHLLLLEHNLQAWRNAAELAKSVCTEFGRSVEPTTGIVSVRGLPSARNGAAFLHNGFAQCVEMNSGFPAARIQVREPSDQSRPVGDVREFVWSEARGRLEAQ